MHDLHLANKIYKLISSHAKKHNLKKVTKIKLELGSIIEHGERINPSNLKFNLKVLDRSGLVEQAEVEVIQKQNRDYWKLVEIEGQR